MTQWRLQHKTILQCNQSSFLLSILLLCVQYISLIAKKSTTMTVQRQRREEQRFRRESRELLMYLICRNRTEIQIIFEQFNLITGSIPNGYGFPE